MMISKKYLLIFLYNSYKQRRLYNISSVLGTTSVFGGNPIKRNELFKAPKEAKTSNINDKIDEGLAMSQYKLSKEQLRDLRIAEERPDARLYYHLDVQNKAIKIHGSLRKVHDFRNKLIGNGKRMRMKLQLEVLGSGTLESSNKVVWTAFLTNMADCCVKAFVAYMTGSKSIFAECIHNLMDTVNQAILLFGSYYSARNPDPNFPYGYGNMRYIASLISGCGILSFGCGLSIYHGITGLLHPGVLESLSLAYVSLAVSACFQVLSLRTAIKELRRGAAEAHETPWNYFHTSADPTLKVVIYEDAAAIFGNTIALGAVTLSHFLNSPIYDSCGSICIGALLGWAAVSIIRLNAMNLLGRSLPERKRDIIIQMLKKDPVIREVHDVKATSVGVNKYNFKAEIDYKGREITQAYLRENCDLAAMLETVKSIKSENELEEFMLQHGEKVIDRIGDEVDRIESKITSSNPDIRHVDLEPM